MLILPDMHVPFFHGQISKDITRDEQTSSCFSDEESEAQSSEVICPKSHSQ